MKPLGIRGDDAPESRRTILVTGGSGVLGVALLQALSGHRVIALKRTRPVGPCAASVAGDVRAPQMGLDADTYEQLCATVDVVVHSAAVTGFGKRADHDGANVEGTAEVLRFAERASAGFVQVSSAFATEGISDVPEPSGYEASKRRGEQLVRDAPVSTTIVRASIIVGDSRTGEITEAQGLHTVMLGIVLGKVPVVPSSGGCRVDFVPCDYVADVIRGVVELDPTAWPSTVWATQGPAALSVNDTLDLIGRFGAHVGCPHEPVKLMPHEMVERLFIPVFLPELPPSRRRLFRSLLQFSRYFNIDAEFPTLLPDEAAALRVGAPADPADLLWQNLVTLWRDHCDKVDGAPRQEMAG